MVTTIPGSEILTSTLNMISQSLQIPVICSTCDWWFDF